MKETLLKQETSADGVLKLQFLKIGNDYIIGFDNHPWHVHADMLIPTFGQNLEEAGNCFIKAILKDELVIEIRKKNEKTVDVFVNFEPTEEDKYKPKSEQKIFRTWSGKILNFT